MHRGSEEDSAPGAVLLSSAARAAQHLPPMDSPNKQKAGGMMDELKGKAKQVAGDVTGDKSMKAEGMADEAKGEAKQAVADGRKKLGDAIDDATD